MVQPIAVSRGADVLHCLEPLSRALDGQGPALLMYASDTAPPVIESVARADDPQDLVLAVGTSGSTGPPKQAMLSLSNLRSSVQASTEVLGGPGAWLLALPAYHVAGIQVLVRSVLSGTTPTVLDLTTRFTATRFVMAASRMPHADRRYVALVPTQLGRLLADPDGRRVLADFDAVLCGGAHTPHSMLRSAEKAGIRLVRTYGVSESAGGCVYDGLPLPVSEIHIDNDRHVVLGGATVGHGYLGRPDLTADAFHTDADGIRWFRTDDLGYLDNEGRLHIEGRANDLVNTGGLKVAPGPVEDAVLRFVPGVSDAVVVGRPDPEWGEVVALAVTLFPGASAPSSQDVRQALRGIVPDFALPRRVLVLPTIPRRGPGKPDRYAVSAAFDGNMGQTSAEG